jgi:death-on-curing protein
MIELKLAVAFHPKALQIYGGGEGIIDRGALESALHRPFSLFDGIDLYPTAIHKAAAITESLLINQPFIDGNKRIGFMLMMFILRTNRLDLTITENEKYAFTIKVAEGKMNIDQKTECLKIHVTELNS